MRIVVSHRPLPSGRDLHGHVRKLRLETVELERARFEPRAPAPSRPGVIILGKVLALGAACSALLYVAAHALNG